MSENGPDAIIGIDADDAMPSNIGVRLIYHNGADTPTMWDKCPTALTQPAYGAQRGAAEQSQMALDGAAGAYFGAWYSTKPPGFKVAYREALLAGRWPLN